jgi:mRNA interferase MazF
MARILRGDIVWADLNPVKGHEQAGQRPVLILSPEVFNQRSGTVIALALTSQTPRAGFPLTMEITSVVLPKPTWVKISQMRTLSVERLGKRMGHVSDDEMSQIVEGLNEIIGVQSAADYRR